MRCRSRTALATVIREASKSFPSSASLGRRSPAFRTPDWMCPCKHSKTRRYFAVAWAGTGSGGGVSLIAALRGPAIRVPFPSWSFTGADHASVSRRHYSSWERFVDALSLHYVERRLLISHNPY